MLILSDETDFSRIESHIDKVFSSIVEDSSDSPNENILLRHKKKHLSKRNCYTNNYYSNYHSIRYVRDELVMRLQRGPTPEQLAVIEKNFSDIKIRGAFRVSGALSAEADEPSLLPLPRLVFVFNRRDHGRLRMLIDYLNDLPG